jgi:hypothetical protein
VAILSGRCLRSQPSRRSARRCSSGLLDQRIIAIAREIDPRPPAVVVWNGEEGDGRGCARDFVSRLGHDFEDETVAVIDPTPRHDSG